MTISSTISRVSYSGNGATTAFSFPYYFLANSDLVVILRDDTTGAETLQTITTHYTVSGAGDDSGGTVTFVTAPASGKTVVIYRDPAATQDLDLVENDSMPAEEVEERLDKLTMLVQRLKDRLDRAVRLSDGFSPSFTPTLPVDLDDAGNKVPLVNSTGTGWASVADWPTADDIDNAEANATTATTKAAEAATSASNAAASATAAQAAADSALWQDVLFKTANYTVVAADRGKLICVDTSGGPVTITLPEISTLDLTSPFSIGVKKTTGDGNNVTIARAGTDTIDGATSKIIGTADAGAVLIPDTDTNPDEWTSADFGSAAGNLTVDRFNGDGSTVAFTLSVAPGTENNTWVYISGVYQQKDTYSVSGTTLTFSAAPPTGTNNIEVMIGTTLSMGSPSDGTITQAKLASDVSVSDQITNLGLAASVASSALTIALKDRNGNDPSSSSPVKLGFRHSTAATGTYNLRSVSSALSLTISSGSTLGHTSGNDHYIYVYALDNAGTVALGASSVIFEDGTLVSTTAEGAAGGADSNRVLYSASALSNVPCRLIGRIKSNQTTAGTWATTPSEIQLAPSIPKVIAFRYHQTVGQSLTNGVHTRVNYGTKKYDPAAMVVTGASWEATVPIAGLWSINARCGFAGNVDAGDTLISVFVNGVEKIQGTRQPLEDGNIYGVLVSTEWEFTAGDTFYISVYQANGTNRTTEGTEVTCWVTARYLGKIT